MKSIIVKGSYINNKMEAELGVYADDLLESEKEYVIFEDGCIANENGHEILQDFVTDEVLQELGL